MRIIIDDKARTIRWLDDAGGEIDSAPLYSPESFDWLSQWWLKVGWNQKYSYTFTWLGRPVIQLPEDLLRIQEVIYQLRPDVIVETGVAHGGTSVFYASLCKLMNHGRVISVDIDIREHARKALSEHELSDLITLIQGDAVAPTTVERVRGLIRPGETALVVLDSCHTRDHVRAELEAYAPIVNVGSYIVVTDGVMRDLHDVPGGDPSWHTDNPTTAVQEFLDVNPSFRLEPPHLAFRESPLTPEETVTYWPMCWVKRISP